MSHYLRNPSTEAPLTLAITGDWGSGKSSLMSLLRSDLADRGWRTVWFNPWHHQAGENLLAPLLAQIIEKGVPPWWHPRGWRFRARLLWTRSRRQMAALLLLLAVFVGSLSYLRHLGPAELESAETRMKLLTDTMAAITKLLPDERESNKKQKQEKPEKRNANELKPDNADSLVTKEIAAAPTTLPSIALLGSLVSLCIAFWRGLKAFGVDVATIVAVEPTTAKPSALRAQAGFRYRFAREFQDVTEAMAPATMVIFMDDLDAAVPPPFLHL